MSGRLVRVRAQEWYRADDPTGLCLKVSTLPSGEVSILRARPGIDGGPARSVNVPEDAIEWLAGVLSGSGTGS